jgi:hypothetical protein
LRAEHLRQFGQQLRPRHRRGVHRDLVGAGIEHRLGILHRAHAAADRERDEHVVGAAAGELRHGLALLMRGGDVEEDDLVRPLLLVAHGQLDRVAGVAQVHELDTLDHAALVHVEARDHATEEHQASSTSCPSCTPNRPSYSALPEITPARFRSRISLSARRSSIEPIPPE